MKAPCGEGDSHELGYAIRRAHYRVHTGSVPGYADPDNDPGS